jgi:hypothetical protein
MANLGTSLPRAMYLRGSQRDSRSACASRIRGTTLHEDWLILES